MKEENITIKGLNRVIKFYIGKNQNENFDVIDMGESNDLWFHANEISSCHVLAKVPSDLNKKEIRYIIKMGAYLCKINTNKLKILNNVEIVYTEIKNIQKTEIPGCVKISNRKIIKI
jgi:predicted ribosome quality control (RQC) complex YloA/Tae2 family protein